MAAALATSASMSRLAAGRIWIVTSRATSDCHSVAAARTSTAAPDVSEARNVMIATTATRARPEIVACGTIGVWKRGAGNAEGAASPASGTPSCTVVSVVDMQPTFVQHQSSRVVLVHQRNVVGRNDHRGPGFVKLDKQSKQALR